MRNPELLRNLWLEFTPHRLIVTPVVMFALFFIAYKTADIPADSCATLAYYLFIFFTFLWGTRCASTAVSDEVNQKTWDWQRMSQLSPSALVIGKLFGSTSFTWFAAFIAFVVYFSCSLTLNVDSLGARSLVIIVGALLTQTLALLFSLQAMHFGIRQKAKSFVYFILAFVIGYAITINTQHQLFDSGTYYTTTLSWHGWVFDKNNFTLVTFLIYLGWALLGVYRSMKSELQYRLVPWAWLAFNLYLIVYFSGFAHIEAKIPTLPKWKEAQTAITDSWMYAAFLIAGLIAYYSFLTENLNQLKYKKWFASFKGALNLDSYERMPKWPISVTFAVLTGIGLAFTPSVEKFSPIIFAGSILLLMARDLLLTHYFHFGKSNKRIGLTLIFYLGVLYFIIPPFFYLLQAPSIAACFLPGVGHYPVFSIIGPTLQVVLVGWLVNQRWASSH